jgi:hypothetical protein
MLTRLGLSQMEYERKFGNRCYPHRTLKTELPFGLHDAVCESPNDNKVNIFELITHAKAHLKDREDRTSVRTPTNDFCTFIGTVFLSCLYGQCGKITCPLTRIGGTWQ